MHPSFAPVTIILLISCLLSPFCLGLTIVSPSAGSTVDPSQALAILWTSSSSDPRTITFKLENSDSSNTLASSNQVLASNVPSQQGRITVPAYTIATFGTGYKILALSASSGDQVAESGSLVLADSSGSVTTLSDGALSFVSTESTTSTTTESESAATGTATATATATGRTATSADAGGESLTLFTGTATAISDSTTGALSVPAYSTRPTGFVTSSTVRAGSASSTSDSASASAAANTNTANRLGVTALAIPAMGRAEVVMGAAGVLAGIVALIV